MFLSTVGRYIRLTFYIFRLNMLVAIEYPLSFLSQVVGMMVNNIFWILLWLLFFAKFERVNGWEVADMALLYAIGMASFGLVMMFAYGGFRLAKKITYGELDYYLSFPVNTLWYTSVTETATAALGDAIFGILLFFLFGDVTLINMLIFFFAVIFSACTLYCFMVLVNSLAFFVGYFVDGAEQLVWAVINFINYPHSVFSGAIKLVMMTVLPAFFMFGLPVEMIRNFDWQHVGILFLFFCAIALLTMIIFRLGLKKYESGNLLNTNV